MKIDFKFGGCVNHGMLQPVDYKLSLKGAWSGSRDEFQDLHTLNISGKAEARIVKLCLAVGYIKL